MGEKGVDVAGQAAQGSSLISSANSAITGAAVDTAVQTGDTARSKLIDAGIDHVIDQLAQTDAGWKADPHARFASRYFDGKAWTEDVADAEGNRSVDPLS